MEFTLTTETIQHLIMSLIFSSHENFMTEEERNQVGGKLIELNQMCNEENNYTLTVSIKN